METLKLIFQFYLENGKSSGEWKQINMIPKYKKWW